MPCPRDLLFPSTLIVRILLAGTALAASLAALPAPAAAAPLRIATWNLGWHVAEAELGRWTAQCAKTYAKDEASGSWRLVAAGTPGARAGWEVDEGRAVLEGVDLSVMPPCNVYRAGRVNVPVTVPAWRKRNEQIAQVLRESVRADVIAFQEVSGEAAVREALGDAADDYRVCSFDGRYKVQRLAFAWRRSLGASDGPCEVIDALSLPQLAPRDQVRPGLVLTLRVDGRRLRFLTVHLKSGCVSPLDRGPLDAPGAAGERPRSKGWRAAPTSWCCWATSTATSRTRRTRWPAPSRCAATAAATPAAVARRAPPAGRARRPGLPQPDRAGLHPRLAAPRGGGAVDAEGRARALRPHPRGPAAGASAAAAGRVRPLPAGGRAGRLTAGGAGAGAAARRAGRRAAPASVPGPCGRGRRQGATQRKLDAARTLPPT
ncbi:hypothetical protein ABXN37_15390 [Piscinibacter sakaiensis]|uniref:hypothetical protein n=1 Tax=Piscinibacter sakaiensis TaxID=1547922 RepID=UPI00372C2D99